MKKLILSLLVAAFVGGNTLSAQTITKNEDGKYSLSVGHVTLTVDAQKGGKIVSYRYDDKEILSQTKIPNSFGSTFWTSQIFWIFLGVTTNVIIRKRVVAPLLYGS